MTSGFPPGKTIEEWSIEPDQDAFRIGSFSCIIRRHPDFGMLLGYIGVRDPSLHEVVTSQPIHGGWTYDSQLNPITGEEDGLHWAGFDCGHFSDHMPMMDETLRSALECLPREEAEAMRSLLAQMEAMAPPVQQVYRNFEYVRIEIETCCRAALSELKSSWKGISSEVSGPH